MIHVSFKIIQNDELCGTSFEDAGNASEFINIFKEFDYFMREEWFEGTNTYLSLYFYHIYNVSPKYSKTPYHMDHMRLITTKIFEWV